MCDGGQCTAGAQRDCDDQDACTVDSCDSISGDCRHEPISCDDGNRCTLDGCEPAAGCAHDPISCDDANECTSDSCDTTEGCVHADFDGECEDGDPCTEGEVCAGGTCGGGTAVDCSDQNPCTMDSCEAASGCVNTPLPGVPCSDGDGCTVGDECDGEACVPGATASCDDGLPCTDDTCVPRGETSYRCEYEVSAGACFVDERCWSAGDIAPDAPCDACSPEVDQREWVTKVDGKPCESEEPCPQGETCQGGVCTPIPGGPCEDENKCTIDVCEEGECVLGLLLDCDDGNECTLDECSPYSGCWHEDHRGDTECALEGGSSVGRCIDGSCEVFDCGNGECDPGELFWTCPEDCGLVGFVKVAAGEFVMGSPPDEEGRQHNEGPQRTVRITRAFWMRATDVTIGEYEELREWTGATWTPGYSPSKLDKGQSSITWWDALIWCNGRSRAEGLPPCYTLECADGALGPQIICTDVRVNAPDGNPLLCEGYRLPTEAEWEYAARAGTTGPNYGDPNSVARCLPPPQPVIGTPQPNAWGLHNMLGDVWEWVWDRAAEENAGYDGLPDPDSDPLGPASGDFTRRRGGTLWSGVDQCRCAFRGKGRLDGSYGGFRPVRTVLP